MSLCRFWWGTLTYTVRRQTGQTIACWSRHDTLTIVGKLASHAHKPWQDLHDHRLTQLLVGGVELQDGGIKFAACFHRPRTPLNTTCDDISTGGREVNKRKMLRLVVVSFHVFCLGILSGTACGRSDDEKLSGLWEDAGGLEGSPKMSFYENCEYEIYRYTVDHSNRIFMDRGRWALNSGKLVLITQRPGTVARVLNLSRLDINKVIQQRTGVNRPKWMKSEEYIVAVDYRIMGWNEHRNLLIRKGRLRLLEEPSWRDWFRPETHPDGYLRVTSPSGKFRDFFNSAGYGRFTKCR